jgi:hypothetical protein
LAAGFLHSLALAGLRHLGAARALRAVRLGIFPGRFGNYRARWLRSFRLRRWLGNGRALGRHGALGNFRTLGSARALRWSRWVNGWLNHRWFRGSRNGGTFRRHGAPGNFRTLGSARALRWSRWVNGWLNHRGILDRGRYARWCHGHFRNRGGIDRAFRPARASGTYRLGGRFRQNRHLSARCRAGSGDRGRFGQG